MRTERLDDHLRVEAALPRERGPKLEVTVEDPAAFEAWCAERGTTPERYTAALAKALGAE